MARTGGPYLQLAALCEKVLTEQDGVLSLVRVIDRLTVNVQMIGPSGMEAPALVTPPVQLTLALAFKSGEYQGTLPLKVRIETPSSFKWPEFSVDLYFQGAEVGANVIAPMQFPAQDEGIYWFVVELGDELMTRIPLRVVKQTSSQTLPPQL
jgi:hypothetical protein